MNENNLPRFTGSSYATSAVPLAAHTTGSGTFTTNAMNTQQRVTQYELNAYKQAFLNPPTEGVAMSTPVQIKSKLRVVRVFLVDPDDRVPVAKRVMHRSDEMTTDATDQELYFDIPVNELLKKHNAERAEIEWEEKTTEGTKTRKGLKEARIRDLVMSVTTIAQF